MLKGLDEPVRNQADDENHHRDREHFRRIELGPVLLGQRTETDEGNQHLTVDHSLDRASHPESNAGENQRQGGRQQYAREDLMLATAKRARHLHQ